MYNSYKYNQMKFNTNVSYSMSLSIPQPILSLSSSLANVYVLLNISPLITKATLLAYL